MATATGSIQFSQATDALFRAWCQVIHDLLVAGGWIQTSDTGQIDLATVLTPSGANQSRGYEVWRSNDSGGGLSEIYIKLEYGSGAVAGYPGIWVTIGWGSDGAGTITGGGSSYQVGTRTQIAFNAAASGVSTYYFCALAGRICLPILSNNVSQGHLFFSLERLIDESGNQSNDIWLIGRTNGGTTDISRILSTNREYHNAGNAGRIMLTTSEDTYDAEVAAGLHIGSKKGFVNASRNMFGINNLAGSNNSASKLGAAGTTVSMTVYGGAHTYVIQSNGTTGFSFDGSTAHLFTIYE